MALNVCPSPYAHRQLPGHLPFHSLHAATADANQCCHLEYAIPRAQMLPDRLLQVGRHLGAAELLPLLAHTVETGTDPAAYNLPFLLAEDGRHLDQGPPHRRSAVDRLQIGVEGNASSIRFRQGIGDEENAASKPTDGVGQPGVRKKSLYTGDTSDTNLSPEIRSGSQCPRHRRMGQSGGARLWDERGEDVEAGANSAVTRNRLPSLTVSLRQGVAKRTFSRDKS